MAVFNPTTRTVEYRNLYGLSMVNSYSQVRKKFCRKDKDEVNKREVYECEG